MPEGPSIALIASLIGDPARANILTSLMDGRALTASELAEVAGVGLSTASSHLEKLQASKLLTFEKQGRHRYFRLNGSDVAALLENMMGLAQRLSLKQIRTGPRDLSLRQSRVCYDHLAGETAVHIYKSLFARGLLTQPAQSETPELTPAGKKFFSDFGIFITELEKSSRPLCLACLDWSERQHHLAGSLGAAFLTETLKRGWLKRGTGRALRLTPRGHQGLNKLFPSA